MKNKLLIGILVLAGVSVFTSCKKCGYCKYNSGGQSATFCGDDLDVNKAACEATNSGTWILE
jgi:hypothetical protein